MIKKRSSWQIFLAVHRALVIREFQGRFGKQKMGYFWAFADPLMMVFVMVMIRTARAGDTVSSYDIAVFLTIGIVLFNVFRNVLGQSLGVFDANKGLFTYKQVKPFDAYLARFVVEIFMFFVVTAFFLFIGVYFDYDLHVKNINGVILAELWFMVFVFGLVFLCAVLSTFFETFAKILRVLSLPLFLLSGIFFTAQELPPEVREILLYNPLFHFMEMLHGNFFVVMNTDYVDYQYMILWTIIPFFAGLWIYRRSEKKIVMA